MSVRHTPIPTIINDCVGTMPWHKGRPLCVCRETSACVGLRCSLPGSCVARSTSNDTPGGHLISEPTYGIDVRLHACLPAAHTCKTHSVTARMACPELQESQALSLLPGNAVPVHGSAESDTPKVYPGFRIHRLAMHDGYTCEGRVVCKYM